MLWSEHLHLPAGEVLAACPKAHANKKRWLQHSFDLRNHGHTYAHYSQELLIGDLKNSRPEFMTSGA
ncbi:hypothetical protein LOK49_LG11G02032 [Camellia lanceoleosa]|uniref:Uncharacterized protein n=1 Tax=Camellia lanceoleosa TaxID=1840588 RepID=A0ACC0G2S8_9ERIC|nr:hypothetical protein LOK49_LG11G02032 [Camellia lanceoleosa]